MSAHHPHGTDARYNHGSGPDASGEGAGPPCREDCCRVAHNTAQRVKRRQKAYGRAGLVDAAPARSHVEVLRDGGMSLRRIRERAGVASSVLTGLLWGRPSRGLPPTARIRVTSANKILAVTPDPVGAPVGDRGEAWVPAVGTMRRLQALAVKGWSGAELAARLGTEQKQLLRVRRGGPRQVTVRTARAVAALYDRLWDLEPPRATATERAYATRTIATAKAEGWAPVGAWDDDTIDDPAAWPVACGPGRGGIADDLEHFSGYYSGEHLAERLGVNVDTVAQVRRRLAERAA